MTVGKGKRPREPKKMENHAAMVGNPCRALRFRQNPQDAAKHSGGGRWFLGSQELNAS
jgi:hypothetical protein